MDPSEDEADEQLAPDGVEMHPATLIAAGCRIPISLLSLPCQWTGWELSCVFCNHSRTETIVFELILLSIWMLFNWVKA